MRKANNETIIAIFLTIKTKFKFDDLDISSQPIQVLRIREEIMISIFYLFLVCEGWPDIEQMSKICRLKFPWNIEKTF